MVWLCELGLVNTALLSVELVNFKRKRVAAFRKNLIEMSELEIKHARVSVAAGGGGASLVLGTLQCVQW